MSPRRLSGWVVVGLPVALVVGAGCRAPHLQVDDVIVPHGQPGRLSASVALPPILGMCKDVENAVVHFFVGDSQAGAAPTNNNGLAALAVPLDGDTRRYEARAQANGAELRGIGRIFTWDAQRVAIAVDIDNTLAQTQRRGLIKDAADPSLPLPHAAATLTELGREYQIIYLTGRPRFLQQKTRDWLRTHGFPEGPVFTARGLFDMFSTERFKTDKLAELRRAWPKLLIGIGDECSDADAYFANGMMSITIAPEPPRGLPAESLRCADWPAVRALFAAEDSRLPRASPRENGLAGPPEIRAENPSRKSEPRPPGPGAFRTIPRPGELRTAFA